MSPLNVLTSASLVLLCGICISSAAVATSGRKTSLVTRICEFYNASMCSESRGQGGAQGCYSKEECPLPEKHDPEKRSHCFVLWHTNATGAWTIKLKGCFLNSADCYNKKECVERAHMPKKDLMFCCCEGDMCNKNFTWSPEPETTSVSTPPTVEPPTNVVTIISYTVIGLLLVALLLVVMYWFYDRRKIALFNELPTSDPHPMPPPSPYMGMRPIQLVEIKARGRFGAVWKAQFKVKEVAVKIFPIQDKQSWQAEQEIFKLPHMDHPNILQYIGVEKRGENLQSEFWLITAYHERGSLCDFLKAHTLTWQQLCVVAETMSRGLMHLHEDIPENKVESSKPALAHRDFKSKNVLLKNDMTACIADFGLALVFQPGKPCGDTHGQVGTRRYMAPEVLEGAINFTRDAFLRIDMYACGLVLWELASRCTAQYNPVPEYRLPFEEEVGQHPTLEDMQESVVQRKVRPTIPDSWRKHTGLQALCDTMEECWDHDAEARLSASCVMERISLQTRYNHVMNGSAGMRIENDAPPASPAKALIV